MLPRIICLCLGVSALWILSACATKRTKQLMGTQLSDFVHHNILDKVGAPVKAMPAREYDPELTVFVGEFIADAKKRGVMIPDSTRDQIRVIKYVDKLTVGAAPGVVAACSRYYAQGTTLGGVQQNRWMVVEVLKKESSDFTMDSQVRMRELVYHELFHCLMNKGHLPAGVVGIMSPVFTKGDDRAFKDWNGLLDDMFSPEFIRLIDAEDARMASVQWEDESIGIQ